MSTKKDNIEQLIVDTIIEKPITFKLDGHFFYLYPPSLGVSLVVKDIVSNLFVDKNIMTISKAMEMLRVCHKEKDLFLRFIAIHSFENRKDILKEELVLERMSEFEGLDVKYIQYLFTSMLQWYSQQELFIKHYHLDIEKSQRERIMNHKNKKGDGSIMYGGRSLYGSVIDNACERYGWTYEYLLWGVSYTNLNMMLSDAVTSVFLTEKEKRELHISSDRQIINADDKRNNNILRQITRED